MMEIKGTQLSLIRLFLLASLVLFSFFIFSGVGAMTGKAGSCPAFQTKEWNKAICDLTLVVTILFQLIYCTFRLVPSTLLHLGKLRPESAFFAYAVQRWYILGELNFTLLTGITAALLSAGIGVTCTNVDCSNVEWYPAAQVAQTGAWLSTICFVPLIVCDVVSLRRIGILPTRLQEVTFTASSGHPEGQVSVGGYKREPDQTQDSTNDPNLPDAPSSDNPTSILPA
ncbi:unnamed protein product [Lymnaea stagnalis]|uniref:Uncharacterized protein n=1 Tax=Lymnaea stagnalis TaxID=6523 RepID=A0AAV2IRF4_LYMST